MDIRTADKAAIAVDLIESYGFQVIPCEAGGKAPATRRGCKDASDDKEVVASWFDQIKDANIGIATGEPSGVIVVDIDIKNDKNAYLNACELCGISELDQPETLIVDTPTGGQHWYFRWPGFAVKNHTNIVPGVDLKGDGGYVIAAGSQIEDKLYDYSLEYEIAELPPRLRQRLETRAESPRGQLNNTWADLQGISATEGGRNQALTRFAGALWNAGCTNQELLAALHERNNVYQPPLPADEVRRVAESADRNFQRGRAPQQGLIGMDYNEFASLPLPAVVFLLAPILARGGLTLIHAPPGVGKTMLAISIAVAVATGQDFLQWRSNSGGRVFFIDGEMTANVMQERFRQTIGAAEIPAGRLTIATPDLVLRQGSAMPDLGTPEGRLIVDQAIPSDTDLIVIDNISALVRTGEENSAEYWLQVQPWALSHRAAGRSILFVHHDNKGGKNYRGTSKIADVMDTQLHLVRPDDYEPDDGARFIVRTQKSRLEQGVPDFEARLTADGWTVLQCESRSAQARALQASGMKPEVIADEFGVSRSTVYRWLRTTEFEDAID